MRPGHATSAAIAVGAHAPNSSGADSENNSLRNRRLVLAAI
ncbi:Uncharacterised protein [Bordetella pertussis]|nr:Uncharacterised protein [Bordetella pertussis]CFW29287.1 Uncharacterised protein [Bordetella pertussis]